jgi:hypothetical protein
MFKTSLYKLWLGIWNPHFSSENYLKLPWVSKDAVTFLQNVKTGRVDKRHCFQSSYSEKMQNISYPTVKYFPEWQNTCK